MAKLTDMSFYHLYSSEQWKNAKKKARTDASIYGMETPKKKHDPLAFESINELISFLENDVPIDELYKEMTNGQPPSHDLEYLDILVTALIFLINYPKKEISVMQDYRKVMYP